MAPKPAAKSAPLHANSVEIPIAGVPRRMVFTNGCLRAIEAATGTTLYGLVQEPARLSGGVLTAVVVAGINAAARQDGTEPVTEDEVDDGLAIADLDKVLEVVGDGVGKALGINIPNALVALRALASGAVDAVAAQLTPTGTSSPSGEDG
jgi:hypothetical protein